MIRFRKTRKQSTWATIPRPAKYQIAVREKLNYELYKSLFRSHMISLFYQLSLSTLSREVPGQRPKTSPLDGLICTIPVLQHERDSNVGNQRNKDQVIWDCINKQIMFPCLQIGDWTLHCSRKNLMVTQKGSPVTMALLFGTTLQILQQDILLKLTIWTDSDGVQKCKA